ncbi:MAG: ComEC/Rec2 family competence protein, partial [Thermoleophilaceae bacterium]
MSRAPRAAGLHRAAERSRQSLRERSAALGPALIRHPRHVLLAAATVGLLLSTRELTTSLALAAAGVAALTAAGGPRLALLTVIVLLGGWGAGQARLEAIDAPGELLTPGDRVAGRAHLLTPPRPGRFGSSAELRMRTGRSAGVRLVGRFGAGAELPAQAGPGTAVDLAGAFRRPRPPDAGGFDFAAHLRRKGVAGELAVTRAHSTGARRGGLAGAIDTARRRAERALAAGLDAPRAALARGMVLGQDERIDPAVRDDFRASGLAHVLAVSGQNVMLLAALALVLLAATGLPRGARILTAIALVVVYVPLAGAGPSLQRAGVMGAASLAALGLARPASRGYALLLAAVVTLLLNPRAVGDPGWQLSFVAVAGILTLAPPLRRGPLRALPRVLAEGVAITVAATLATAPLLAHHFGSVPVAGLPANVLALPLVAPIMWLGMLRAGLGQLTRPALAGAAPALVAAPLATVAELLNRALAVPLGHLTGALASLAGAFAELPGAQLWIPLSSPALLAAGYAGIALGALAAARLARRVEPRVTVAGACWRRLPRERRVAGVCAVAAVVGLVLARGLSAPAPPGGLTVSFLDVGQGDATLIQHPDGTAVLFDGGPPEGRAARLLRASGVRRLAALVMTHPSRDHHGGLLEVVRRFPVD